LYLWTYAIVIALSVKVWFIIWVFVIVVGDRDRAIEMLDRGCLVDVVTFWFVLGVIRVARYGFWISFFNGGW